MYEHNTHVPISHFRAWRASKKFALDAEIKMLVNVPRWRPGGLGYDFWVKVLGPLTNGGQQVTTVAACVAKGKEVGLSAGEVQRALRWLWTWEDQCLVGGEKFVAMVPAPTGIANTSVPAETAPTSKAKKAKKAQVA